MYFNMLSKIFNKLLRSSLAHSYKTSQKFYSKSQYMYENSPEYFCQSILKLLFTKLNLIWFILN